MWGNRFGPERVSNLSTLQIPQPLDMSEVLLPLRAGFVGAVTGARIATGFDGFTYTFTPVMNLTGRADVNYYTMQYVERGDTNRTIDIPKVFATNLTITVPDGNGLVQMSASYQGGKADDPGSAAAGGLTIAARALCPKRLVSIGIYDNYAAAAAATPAASGVVRSVALTIPTGLAVADNLSADAALDYDAVGLTRIGESATAVLSIYTDPENTGFEREELVHKNANNGAGDLRYLRLRLRVLAGQVAADGQHHVRVRHGRESWRCATRRTRCRCARATTAAGAVCCR